ncbi:Beta-secretase 2 [Oryzias melastigma]|uniref:Beta-secretase 2 n=1 Tax=Oryzias melastigma TaxID=30732 RepID=A0A3B3BEZ3_ORYME|nr:beta-secretase 2 [Oryzias melastigma]KAF6721642.1 Beta-secretase 2 [Oryzias melastigma]
MVSPTAVKAVTAMACSSAVSMWALAFSLSFGLSECHFSVPLRIHPGKYNLSARVNVSQLHRVALKPDGSGLSFASDPTGTVNFLDMVGNLQGDSGRGYYIEMLVGTPGQKLNILLDTGSSNFAIAAAPHPYITHYFNTDLSSSFQALDRSVAVRYTQGNWEGELGIDNVSIPKGPNGTITVNIAAILSSDGFFLLGINWQGILGMAYPALARPDSSVEPFFNSVVKQLGIPDVFSLQMCGAGLSGSSTADLPGGSLIMGGAEPTLYRGSVWYTPIVEEWYYQVEVLKLEVGDQNLNLDCKEYNMDKAIVDSGTTMLRLPVKVFNAVVEAITRSSLIQEFSSGFWEGTKLACWMKGETPWRFFPKLSIYLRATNTSQSFRITILPQLYIQPITDEESMLDCFRFGVSSSANGLVIGATVMEGFYVVFDRAHKRLGFALSSCAVNGDVALSEIAGPFSAADVAADCSSGVPKEPLLWVISYALMAVCAVILVILLLLLLLPCRRRGRFGEITDESSLVRHRIK